jgi:hypothetical protein
VETDRASVSGLYSTVELVLLGLLLPDWSAVSACAGVMVHLQVECAEALGAAA